MEDGSTRMERSETLDGRLAATRRGRLLGLVTALTGLLIVKAVGAFVGSYLFGFRRPCTLRIDDDGLVLDARTCLLGREIGSSSTRIVPWNVESVAREDRLGSAPVLAGALFFVLGAGLGFGFLVEWAWTRFGVYIILCAALVALGIAIDLVAVYLMPVARRRTSIVVRTRSDRFRVTDVDEGAATRFTDECARRMASWHATIASSPGQPARRG